MEKIRIVDLSEYACLFEAVLAFVRIYEDVCCRLYSVILEKSEKVYALSDCENTVLGVFSLGKGGLVLPCLPNDSPELRQALRGFLRYNRVFCVSGKAEFVKMLTECIRSAGKQVLAESRDYEFLEAEEAACSADADEGNFAGFSFKNCVYADGESLFPLQLAYISEEVVPAGFKISRASERYSLDRALKKGNVYALRDCGGNFVCKLHVNAVSENFALIGGVYTLPSQRKKGLAKYLLSRVIDSYRIKNKGLVLFAGKSNAAALALYKSCGFKPISSYTITYWK